MQSNKVVFITGGASGLGYAITEQLRQQQRAVVTIGRSGDFVWDMSEPDAIPSQRISDAAEEKSVLLILNAATIAPLGFIGELDASQVEESAALNYLSVARLLALFAGHPRLHVVLISTGAARTPIAGWSSYCASKAATEMLLACFALENPDAVVNSIDPGIIDTSMQDQIAAWSGVKLLGLQTPEKAAAEVLRQIELKDELMDQGKWFAISYEASGAVSCLPMGHNWDGENALDLCAS
jgi:NAD(P)-dependent dehydrogenase (short-subunit alcohol dehydrogenase family)